VNFLHAVGLSQAER